MGTEFGYQQTSLNLLIELQGFHYFSNRKLQQYFFKEFKFGGGFPNTPVKREHSELIGLKCRIKN